MVSIFDFSDYRVFLDRWIDSHGEGSYGLKGKIANSLNISSSLFSQIQKGERSLSSDQSYDLASFMGLNEMETDFLQLLVEFDKSGSYRHKERLQRKINLMKQQSQKISSRVPKNRELSDEQKAIFYSSWLYTGITNLTAIEGVSDLQAISTYLKMEPSSVQRVLRFLLEIGICKEQQGKITTGDTAIHVDRESPFVTKHHQNWRLKSMNQLESRKETDHFFTSPMSLSKEAAEEIRKMIPHFIQSVMKISGPSSSEVVRCLNIDWFEY